MSDKTTASIDLAQLDKKHVAVLKELLICCLSWEPQVCVLGNVRAGDAAEAIQHVLARRSLTSGTPAEPIYQQRCGEVGGYWEDIGKSDYDDPLNEVLIVYAAPVHDAAAPSAEHTGLTTVECPTCHNLVGSRHKCDDCDGQGRIIVSAKDMAGLSAGAAAKSEQAPEHETIVQEGSNLVCTACGTSATAAGAGSAQPRAEGDERALMNSACAARYPEGAHKHTSTIMRLSTERDAYRAGWQDRAALDQSAQAATTASASGQQGASQAPQWRPVTEAPRDGTRFWYLRPTTVVSASEPARIKYDIVEVWRKRTTPDSEGYWMNFACSMADHEVRGGWFLLSDPDRAAMRANDSAAEGGDRG